MPFTRRAPAAHTAPSTSSTPTSTSTSTSTPATSHSNSSRPSSLSSVPPSTRPSPSGGLPLLPTGIPSLDDLLGGGLPLASVLLLLGPDPHTSWPLVIARHWIAQGLISGHKSVVVAEKKEGEKVVKSAPWVDRKVGGAREERGAGIESEGESEEVGAREVEGEGRGGKRIAWRYDGMKKFQTTVSGSNSGLASNTTIPPDILTDLIESNRQVYLPIHQTPTQSLLSTSASKSSWLPPPPDGPVNVLDVLKRLDDHIEKDIMASGDGEVVRITIPDLGGIGWGVLSDSDVMKVLKGMREIVRSRKLASAVVTLPPSLSAPVERIKRLAWCVDACIELVGFGSDPTLAPLFHPAHGLLRLHSFPHAHHLLPPTIRFSSLLGLSSTLGPGGGGSMSGGGAAENNLGFRMKRKRFVIETVHLGIEGGTGERRTEPSVEVGRMVVVDSGKGQMLGGSLEAVEGVDRGGVQAESGIGPRVAVGEGKVEKKVKKERTRVRFGDDVDVAPVLISIDDDKVKNSVQVSKSAGGHHSHNHDHEHGGDHDHKEGGRSGHAPRVAIRHDRPDLYEF